MLPPFTKNARMAESVDALVSNTSGRKAVPVRSRLRVQTQKRKALIHKELQGFYFYLLKLCRNIFLFRGFFDKKHPHFQQVLLHSI